MKNRTALLPFLFLLLLCCWTAGCQKLEIPDDTEKPDTETSNNKTDSDDNKSSDSSDDSSTNDDDDDDDDDSTSSPTDTTSTAEPDSGVYRGYKTLATYFKHYGKTDEAPVPFEDILAGGCIYNHYIDKDEADISATTSEGKPHWIEEGYIVGYIHGTLPNGAHFSKDGSGTSIIIAASSTEMDGAKCIPIELKSGSKERKLLGKDKNISIGTKVQFRGVFYRYFGVVGLKKIDSFAIITEDE